MRVKILGCHGGELPGCRTTCLLFDDRYAVDAGALTATLPLPRLLEVDDIFLTHSHFDHVKDVPLLADIVVGRRSSPVRVHGTQATLQTLRDSVFNGELWPDFTRLPSPERPALAMHPVTPGTPVAAGHLTFTAVPVQHPVDAVGYLVSEGERFIVISGDTGPTEALWAAARAREGLAAVFLEVSFPNDMQWLADASGHFTPRTLVAELDKFDERVPVFLYHLKPAYLAELRREIAALGISRLHILELDESYEF